HHKLYKKNKRKGDDSQISMSETETRKEKKQLISILIGGFIIFSVGMSLLFIFVDFNNLNDPSGDSGDSEDETDANTDNSTDDDGGG
ncbi:MAG: hypothetical protein ACOC44_14470, partial [Promethearchaeia archaeon]